MIKNGQEKQFGPFSFFIRKSLNFHAVNFFEFCGKPEKVYRIIF